MNDSSIGGIGGGASAAWDRGTCEGEIEQIPVGASTLTRHVTCNIVPRHVENVKMHSLAGWQAFFPPQQQSRRFRTAAAATCT
jgi:hypothetical protein